MSPLDSLNRKKIRKFAAGGATAAQIEGLYGSVLGRSGDAIDQAGLDYWTEQANKGASLAEIQSAFQSSPEAQARSAATTSGGGNNASVTVQSAGDDYAPTPNYGATSAINQWYLDNLGRPAEQTGLDFWGKSFGDTLDPNEITQLQQSPEYTNRQAITGYYDTILGRSPDDLGLQHYQQQADSGRSIADIRAEIAASQEAQTRPTTVFEDPFTVQNQYTFNADDYLQNNPDVAANPYYSQNPYEHYLNAGQAEGRNASFNITPEALSPDQWEVYDGYRTTDPFGNEQSSFRDPATGNVYRLNATPSYDEASGVKIAPTAEDYSLVASGAAMNDRVSSLLGLDPEKAQTFYDLKETNPEEYYNKAIKELTDTQFQNWWTNDNGKNAPIVAELDRLKEKDPNAYYQNQLDLFGKQLGWQIGQNTSERNDAIQEQYMPLVQEAIDAGMSQDQIGQIVDRGVNAGNYQNQMRIINEQQSAKAGNVANGIVFVGSMALAATGVGAAATSYLAGSLTAAGVNATVATGIASATVASATAATITAIQGGDIGKAALAGAIGGGALGTMSSAMSSVVPADLISGISDMTNLTTDQVKNVISTSFATATTTAAMGANSDKILQAFGTALVASGLSQSIANEVKDVVNASFNELGDSALEKIAAATQVASGSMITSALSGGSPEQITMSVVSSLLQNSGRIANAGAALENQPRDSESTGLTTGAVDEALIRPVINQNAIDLANASDDVIGTMNSVKNWTGDAKNNLVQATGEMLNQGMNAVTISQNLQDFYNIPEVEATRYADYMVDQRNQLVGPTQPTKTGVTVTGAPADFDNQGVVGTQSINTTRELTRDREASRDPVTTTAPVSGNSVVGGMAGSAALARTLPFSSQISSTVAPYLAEAGSALRTLGPAMLALYPSELGSGTLTREQIDAMNAPDFVPYGIQPTVGAPGKPISEGYDRLPGSQSFEGYGNAPGKPISEGYGGIPFNPANHVPVPTPMLGEAAPAAEGFDNVPVLPGAAPAGEFGDVANDPAMFNPDLIPGQESVFTPRDMGTVSIPTGAPKPTILPVPVTTPEELPVTAPAVQPAIRPGKTPDIDTGTKPGTDTETAPAVAPQVQEAINTVARTQAEAQALTQAVPMVIELVQVQGIPRTIAIPRVAVQVGVSVGSLTQVIDTAIPPEVIGPPTTDVPDVPDVPDVTPSVTPKTPTPKTPTTPQPVSYMRAAKRAEEDTGIYDLGPAFTKARTDYNLAGQFNMASGGAVATSQYDPFGLANNYTSENSGVYGGDGIFDPKSPFVGSNLKMPKLTIGKTKPNPNYELSGYPLLGKTNIGMADGGSIPGHNPQFFSEGGLGTLDNRYVQGEGDGTSDEVPAMLATGEFVIPADVVAKLGNGSNEAGAGVLDQFLMVIREHNQKHDPKNLPPDSKGPLAYLSEAKKRA